MPDNERFKITPEETGLDRRKFMAVASALAAPAAAGCIGGGDDDGDDDVELDDSPDRDDAPDVQEGGTLQVAMESPLDGLDPAYAGLWVDYSVGSLMHQQLFEVDQDFNLVGLLAEDMEISEDGLTWDISLREGVMFHPPYEREMVAEDVVYNFDRIADPDVGSPRAEQLEPIDSWEAVDDYTFRMELPRQLASLPAWLGFMGLSVLSPDALEEEGGADQHPVGTGPFKFEEWQPREELRMSKFEDYWEDDMPIVDEVVVQPITEEAARVTELTTGNVHIDRTPPKDEISSLDEEDDIIVDRRESGGYRMLHVNPAEDPDEGRAPEKPTTELEVRQAINEAIDRPDMIEFVDNGFGVPTQTWFPEDSQWHVDYEPFSMEANPERAQELIEEAGFETPLEITILSTPDDEAIRDVGQVLQDQLLQAGFDPNLEELEIGTWVGRLSAREFDIAVDWSVSTIDPGTLQGSYDQENFPRALTPVRGIHDNIFDLFDQAAETQDDDEREEVYTELQEELADLSLNIPLYFRDLIEAYRTNVWDYETHPHFLNWKQSVDTAWIEEEE